MIRAAAYIRVSTDEQTDYSPAAQLDEILAFAKTNGYYIAPEFIFRDEGISGRSADKRPAFQEMIRQAKKKSNQIEAVIVHKFDRFSRKKDDTVLYKALLKRDGVKVISVKEPIPDDDKFAVIYESMLEAMAEYYSLNLAEEVKKTMIKKAHLGEYQSTAPYGYQNENKSLTIVPDEAKIIQMVFEKYANYEETMFSLSRILNAMGCRTHRGNVFENRTIQYIINNPTYKGYSRWTPTGRIRRNYENPDSVVVKGTWEPIISEELWDKAAERYHLEKRKNQKHKRPDTEGHHWISSMIKCSSCGRSLIISSKNKTNEHFSMQCGGYNHGQCHVSHAISTSKLLPAIMGTLEIIASTEYDPSQYNIQMMQHDTSELDTYVAIKQKLHTKLARAKDAYLAEIDTLEDYKKTKQSVDAELAMLNEKIADLERQTASTFDAKLFSAKVRTIIDILNNPNQSMQSKKEAFKSVVSKVVYHKAEDKIQLFFIGN